MLDLAAHFSAFLKPGPSGPPRLHFAAHSHHPWPDATRAAHMQAWDNAARLIDGKWAPILSHKWQELAKVIAGLIKLPDPATLCFAPNTHEFAGRILSAMPAGVPIRVLTTDAEFHSFSRQIARLEEEGLAIVTRIPAEPAAECLPRLVEAAQDREYDLIWVSEVFFSSGAALSGFEALAAAAGEAALVIDGYHAFMARPVDVSAIADRAFYLAGGYKYAMGGEGCCFMHCPPGWLPRPRNTGWYAAFGALGEAQGGVGYASDGWRFMGATFDPSGLYRLHAALNWAASVGATPGVIHDHAHALQRRFVAGLGGTGLDPARLVVPVTDPARGNFLTFALPDAEAWQAKLEAAHIITDRRGDRLRFGFGIYQREGDVDALLERMRSL
jgi:kynureninase